MADNCLFQGILPALITPLNDDASVRIAEVGPLVRFMLARGADGFYVLGGTGEGAVLAEGERVRMAEAVAEALEGSGKHMIVHVGAADTASAFRLARHAAQIGADAISSVYPNFFCAYGAQEAAEYYGALVQASGLPMLAYCTPMIRNLDVLALVERLMAVEGVIGVKYTFSDCYQLQRIKQLNGGNINVINGPDETLLCGLCMGADGGIGASYNLMPARFARLYERFMANDLAAAIEMQRQINRLIAVLLRCGLIPTIKLALEALGFSPGHAAYPGHRFDLVEREQVIAALTEAGLFEDERAAPRAKEARA